MTSTLHFHLHRELYWKRAAPGEYRFVTEFLQEHRQRLINLPTLHHKQLFPSTGGMDSLLFQLIPSSAEQLLLGRSSSLFLSGMLRNASQGIHSSFRLCRNTNGHIISASRTVEERMKSSAYYLHVASSLFSSSTISHIFSKHSVTFLTFMHMNYVK